MFCRAQRTLLLFLFPFSFSIIHAQQFGGNPPSLKWRQINTDTVRIIFPAGLDSSANRVASVVHDLQKNHTATIGSKLRKINIVLQNQTTLTNGYVSLAPFRSEFYLIPEQNSFELGSTNWESNLAVHEFRHVQQYNNFNVGFSRFARFVLGEEGQALANGLSVPDWFFEGDAVFNETSLTKGGRGRIPAFFSRYKSLMLAGKNYSYMKLRNGSLRDYVPGHYELGYMLVTYGREKYGAEFWKKVTQDAAAFKPFFYPLQGAVKKYSGVSYNQFVKDAFQFYHGQWKQDKESPVQWLTPNHKNYINNYQYPYITSNGEIIVLKQGNRHIPAFYLLHNGIEKKIATREIVNDYYFSYNNGKIIYSFYKPDARWGYREYSNIKLLDVATGQTTPITKNARYFAPDISHDGNTIVAAEMLTNQSSNIVMLDLNGNVLSTHKGQAGQVFTYPKFSADDKYIYTAVRNSKGLMALQKISVNDQSQTEKILPFDNRIIGLPVVQGDTIFFSSSYKGSDETWAYIESKHTVYRVAKSATGYYQAAFNSTTNSLVTSTFTSEGYRLASIPASLLLWQKINDNENALPDLYATTALKQENSNTLNNIPSRNFQTSKYHKATNIFNFHSWRPYYDDPEFSFTVYGQNVLNTFESEVYYAFNNNDESHKLGANVIYGGTYIRPLAGINQTWLRHIRYNIDTTIYYNELTTYAGIDLPLNFSGGKQYRFLNLRSLFNTDQVSWTGIGQKLLRNQQFNYIQSRISYSSQIQKPQQHIYPHWAQTIALQYRNIINKYTANQFLATGTFYLPGFHPTHNIVLSAALHTRDTMNQYLFSNNFPFSRGYTAVDFPRMWRLGANYHFPIAYPDWGFGNIVYLLRLRANAFYDYTQAKSLRTGTKFNFRSTGAEIFFDTKWWNQQEVSFGIRYSRLLDNEFRGATNPNQWEFILPVNLLSN